MPRWLVDSLQTLDSLQMWIMYGLIISWLFFFGACFASFLNVVAWRVPRGRGINGSSYCPHCNVRLRMSDNMPIVGWLKNGGRCRDCKTPITFRYLIVELSLGLVTLLLVALTVFWSGINLPGTGTEHRLDVVGNLIADPRNDLIQIVCFHLVLVYGLFTTVVIRTEKLPVPRSIVIVVAVIGVGLSAFLPHCYVVDWLGQTLPKMGVGKPWLATVGLGLVAGLIAGAVLDWLPALQWEYKDVKDVDSLEPAAWENSAEQAKETAVEFASDSKTDGISAEHESNAADLDCDANGGASEASDEDQGIENTGVELESGSPKLAAPVSVESLPDGVATMAWVGLFLGWQAVVTVVAILVCLLPVRRLFHCRLCGSLAAQVFLATLVQLVGWRLIAMVIPF
jgi:prepilin signal peptidase PulO-like enzyme (type II secretory pathway)